MAADETGTFSINLSNNHTKMDKENIIHNFKRYFVESKYDYWFSLGKGFFIIPIRDMLLIYQIEKERRQLFLLNNSIEDILKNKNVQTFINKTLGIPIRTSSKTRPVNRQTRFGLMLSLTSDCNLRCSYCYIYGGNEKTYMSWDIAKRAIDYSIKRCKQQKIEHISLSFVGQGEPTLNWEIFCNTVDYFTRKSDQQGLKGTIGLTTNGTFSKDKAEYLKSHGVQITVSMDCSSANLDKLRPTVTGESTLKLLENTLHNLELVNVAFNVRSTVTELNVVEMSDFVNFLSTFKTCKAVHFEPLILMGRAKNEKLEKEFYDNFIKNFESAKSLGFKKGLIVVCSGGKVDYMPDTFCSAIGKNLTFCVSADGLISSCYEHLVFSSEDSFMYGRITTDSVDILSDKYHWLKKNSGVRATCDRCFLLSTCRGDCPSKVSSDELRCYLNRKIAKTDLFIMSLQPQFENKGIHKFS